MPGIADHHKANFETIKAACENEDLCIIDSQRVSDGVTVVLLAAHRFNPAEGMHEIVPLAEMIDGDPFKLYRGPTPGGGYEAES